ncbi:hypothetical protein OG609_17880 [Streptomyces sp. NBC_01224]|uniref:hypothetical protein n=1 Tax=Streptomyces sp. NBC_01224 TaxID=2903783 RepID=UPI002E11737D|nr:hypothetical protein OG609_17880 [Streptomyces sp. NBC_01224]
MISVSIDGADCFGAGSIPAPAGDGPDGDGTAGSGPDPSPSFVVLHRSAVLDALSALFEALWAIAQPLRTQDEAGDAPQALSNRTSSSSAC